MSKDLLKNLVLEVIGKNFRFIPTPMSKIYQILEKYYNYKSFSVGTFAYKN